MQAAAFHLAERYTNLTAGGIHFTPFEAADFARFLRFFKKQSQTLQDPCGTAFQNQFGLLGMTRPL